MPAVFCLAGCGGQSTDRYIPQREKARRAIEAALAAWKSDAPRKTISSFETPIDLYDARWRDGRKLESFEVLEELPADPHPAYRVSLRFGGKDQDEQSTYLVMGIDPILVFRSEDYHRATGM
jgi:hypothetical protein